MLSIVSTVCVDTIVVSQSAFGSRRLQTMGVVFDEASRRATDALVVYQGRRVDKESYNRIVGGVITVRTANRCRKVHSDTSVTNYQVDSL